MNINEATKQVLAMLGDIAILMNRKNESRWGVLFNTIQDEKGNSIDEAWTFAKSQEADGSNIMVRISEMGEFTYDSSAPYYHYVEEGFMRNQLPIEPIELHKKIAGFEFIQAIRFPYGNLINFIYDNFPDPKSRERVRIIINKEVGVIDEGHIVCKFDEDGVFKHPQVSKPFAVDKYSKLSLDCMSKDKLYQCQVINETETFYLVNVKKEYFRGIQVGLYETVGGGYFPDSPKQVLDFSMYLDKRVLKVPFLIEGKYAFEPIYLDCNALMSCLKLFAGFNWVDIVVGSFSNHPVLITGVREDGTFPNIECFLATLNPTIKGGVR